jgi:hypothetical protein
MRHWECARRSPLRGETMNPVDDPNLNQYKVLSAYSRDRLEELVNHYLNRSYVPHGGLHIIKTRHWGKVTVEYVQAVVRVNRPDEAIPKR